MHLFISIVGAILAIFVIILLHEMGHFFVARAFGIKIIRFSIGFGKAIYKRVAKDGTEYAIGIVPLGGYVKMLGETDVKDVPASEMHRSFNRKPLLVRMAVVLAGPFTNFVLAIVVFWAAYLIGISHVKPVVGSVVPKSFAAEAGVKSGDHILKVGGVRTYNWQQVIMKMFLQMGDPGKLNVTVMPKNSTQTAVRSFNLSHWKIDKRKPEIFKTLGMFPLIALIPPVVKRIMPKSPAAKAGLMPKDRITSINGKPIHSWNQAVAMIRNLAGHKAVMTVQRDGHAKTLNILIGHQLQNKKLGYLGVMVVPPTIPASMLYKERYNVLTAWKPAVIRTWVLFKYNALVLEKMITAKLSFKVIGGPISIFQAAGKATHAGLEVYLGFIGFISLAVGFINLLPIPGLDGGHFLFQLIEAIIRRPVPDRIQAMGFTFGMLFVIFIVVHATINDLYRIFG